MNVLEAMDDPQLRFREMIVEDESGNEHLGIPVKFLNEPGRINFALPGLGEHNAEIARELGYADADIEAMQADGAFG